MRYQLQVCCIDTCVIFLFQKKTERNNIIKSIKTTPSDESSDGPSKAPTVEELMEQNRVLQMKLQLAYDQVNKEKKSAGLYSYLSYQFM